jgi:hypothetical protein
LQVTDTMSEDGHFLLSMGPTLAAERGMTGWRTMIHRSDDSTEL